MPKKTDINKATLSRVKRKVLKHYFLIRVLIIVSAISIILLSVFYSVFIIKIFLSWEYYLAARNFLNAQTNTIAQTSGRTNVLILGKGGAGHTAPDLTDTIIVASVPDDSNEIALVSIPRDLWIDELETKINTIYEKGNAKSPDGGLILAKSAVEEVLGQPIHYAVTVDFGNFKQLIDAVGGIDVDVENSFVDKLYPILGREEDLCEGDKEFKCRYETISFEKGQTHMDGETALKFARSRYAEGDEGTDVARQERQQKVIVALKNKLSDPKVYTNLKLDLVILRIVRSFLETDLDLPEMATLARMVINSRDFANFVIPETLIYHPTNPPLFSKIYVFIPRKGVDDWGEIQKWFSGVLTQ